MRDNAPGLGSFANMSDPVRRGIRVCSLDGRAVVPQEGGAELKLTLTDLLPQHCLEAAGADNHSFGPNGPEAIFKDALSRERLTCTEQSAS